MTEEEHIGRTGGGRRIEQTGRVERTSVKKDRRRWQSRQERTAGQKQFLRAGSKSRKIAAGR